MDFMSLHLLKMRELQQYRQDRKKANLIAYISEIIMLLFVGFAIWLKFKFIGG